MENKPSLLLVYLCVTLSYLISGDQHRAVAGEPENFSGTWVANGSKQVLPFGDDRETALFTLSGHVNLTNPVGKDSDYWSTCIGLADSKKGSDVRCVWKSLSGQEIYLVLNGERLKEGSEVTGEIIGGNREAEGISGTINFTWASLFVQSSNGELNIGGYAKEISGSYQLP